MRLNIGLQDDLADHYRKEADERHLVLESVVEGRLGAAVRLDPRNRYVIVTQPVLGKIEEKLGGGHVQDEGDLYMKVQRLAAIQFEGHTLRLTPGQLEELAWRAEKQGKPLAQLIQETWDRFAEEFFTLVPGMR